jgi:hypothetical protein
MLRRTKEGGALLWLYVPLILLAILLAFYRTPQGVLWFLFLSFLWSMLWVVLYVKTELTEGDWLVPLATGLVALGGHEVYAAWYPQAYVHRPYVRTAIHIPFTPHTWTVRL